MGFYRDFFTNTISETWAEKPWFQENRVGALALSRLWVAGSAGWRARRVSVHAAGGGAGRGAAAPRAAPSQRRALAYRACRGGLGKNENEQKREVGVL